MPAIIGQIRNIVDESTNYKKKIVELSGNKGKCFVEFRGDNAFFLDKINKYDLVMISFLFDGKKSRLGKTYNNLVATSIEKL